MNSGAVGGKTGKTLVLPGFFKIVHSNGSGCVPHCFGGLTKAGRARRAGGAADENDKATEGPCITWIFGLEKNRITLNSS